MAVSPITRGSFGRFQTALSCTPQILKALCLNIFIPGIFRVSIEMIVIHFPLKECIFSKIAACLTSGRKSLSNLTLSAAINLNFYTLTQVAKGMNIWV